MNLTHHAKFRMKQRQISELMINLAVAVGRDVKHSDKIFLAREDIDQLYTAMQTLIKQLERV